MRRADNTPQRRLRFICPPRSKEAEEGRLDYLRPNRYFRFFLLKEKSTERCCWAPEGFTM